MVKLKAYNKRLKHTAEISMIDFESGLAKLIMPNTEPKFIYHEKISNLLIRESSGIIINDEEIFEGDIVKDTKTGKQMAVKKQPGGFYPFVAPIKASFKKVKDG